MGSLHSEDESPCFSLTICIDEQLNQKENHHSIFTILALGSELCKVCADLPSDSESCPALCMLCDPKCQTL